MLTSNEYSFGSLFAGIGGICIGFSTQGFSVKWANELDPYACQTYRLNQSLIDSDLEITQGDVRDFHPKCNVDVLGGGFPCQPYSVAGRMMGLEDDRGRPMFEEILRIAAECHPRAIFLENVGNLKTFDEGRTFPILMRRLEESGYSHHMERVLNSKDYSGIAQFRNRIYITAFRDSEDCEIFEKLYPECIKKRPVSCGFEQIVSKDPVLDKYYYSQNEKGKCISIRFNEHFVPAVTEKGVFYQYRRNKMRRNQSGLCPALTASMGGGGHNVPIILDAIGIRKLTPQECLKVQGFPDRYRFPEGMANCHKYRQVGNSVSVPVIQDFAALIRKTFEEADTKSSEIKSGVERATESPQALNV